MSKTKLTLTFLIGIIFVSLDHSFADNINNLSDCMTDANTTEILATLMDIILRLMGWFWIPFATIAGKLMTNNMIYGEFLNLDKSLYMLRNVSRTFANFTVAGLIIWYIIEGVTTKELNIKDITKKIGKLAIGIIVANSSRFLAGATLDISTILTTAIGGLPGTYFSTDEASRIKIIESTQVNESQRRMTLDTTAKLCDLNKILKSDKSTNTTTTESDEELLDKILPKSDSVSGPLLYIGSSVIKIQNLMYTSNTSNSPSDHLMIILIRVGIVIVFFIAIILILVINIFRMVYLWFFIAFSPLLAILFFGSDSVGSAESAIEKFLPKFSISNIIKLIFAPVVSTGLLSVLLIVIVLMQQVLQSNNSYVHRGDSITMRQGTTVETTSNKVSVSTISSPGVFETTLQGNILSNSVSNAFSDLLMLGVTIVLFWGFIKAIMKYSEDGIGGDTIKSLGGLAGDLLTNAPILNIGGSKVGLGTARDKAFGNNSIMNDISKKFGEKQRGQEEDIENLVRGALGQRTLLSQKDYKPLLDHAHRLGEAKYQITDKEEAEFFSTYDNTRKAIEGYYNNPEAGLVSLSSMSGVSEAFPILLKAMSKSTYYKNKYKLTDREEGKTTINSYITANYENNNESRGFFNNLYKKLGGDPNKLKTSSTTSIGDQFWSKKFHRQQDKTSAPDKEE